MNSNIQIIRSDRGNETIKDLSQFSVQNSKGSEPLKKKIIIIIFDYCNAHTIHLLHVIKTHFSFLYSGASHVIWGQKCI